MHTIARSLSCAVVPLIALSPIISGCTTAIENRPPYACKVIPHHIFELLVDPKEKNLSVETEIAEGSFAGGYYSCVAEKAEFRYIYQQWQGSRASETRQVMLSEKSRYDAENLPSELGEGWLETSLGTAWLSWRCGDVPVLIRVSAPGDRDRDEREDLLRLLEIAQQRYAELNDCEIRPPE